MKEKDIKFVGLHQHSHYSVFDGFGAPSEAIDFAIENGSEALALTDHGTMAGLADQVLHAKKLEQAGVKFKPIYGIEAYYHPSISEWQNQYEEHNQKNKKKTKKEKEAEQGGVVVEDEDYGEAPSEGLNLRHRRHMVLLAKNQTGLNNLFTMISKSYTRPYYYFYPRIDLELLKQHSEGIVATSACIGGLLGLDYFLNREEGEEAVKRAMRSTVESMMDIYGEDFYGELQWNALEDQHKINKHIIDLHHEYGFELISTADAHFPSPEHWRNRELYKRLGWVGKKEKVSDIPNSIEEMDYQLYPKNGNQMWESYKKYSEKLGYSYDDKLILDSIERTHDISFKKIDKFYPDNSIKLPSFISDVDDYDAQLRKLATEELINRGLNNNQEYVQRVEKELSVIIKKGFSRYFITMKTMVDIARELMLIGGGRGSGGGSLVAYLLGITEINPLKWNLQFERFLREDDNAYPDIDVDIEDPMILKEHLAELWGEDSVAPVSNWVTLKFKSAIKDVAKLYDVPFEEVNEVTTKMMDEAIPRAKAAAGQTSGVYDPSFDECKQYSATFAEFLKKYPHLEHPIRSMQGALKSLSRHAGGLIVADNLGSQIPLIRSSDIMQTPWSKDLLEPMGFIKFDLLGLDTLKMFHECIERILRLEQGIEKPTFEQIREWYEENLSPDNIDLEDPKVWEVFKKGNWLGTFQFTQNGAQRFCKSIAPDNLIILAIITSIFRPGPLEAGVHKDYVDALNDPNSVHYLNDIHREVAESTLGFLVFQEQIAELAHKLGKDISLDEGNYLRKLLTKRNSNKEKVEAFREKFVEGCLEKDISQDNAEELFRKFEYFSGYGFNKSHAVAYGIISYQCAYLWTYYPIYWAAAFLQTTDKKKLDGAIAEVRSYGIEIETPNINKSSKKWEVGDDKRLYQPLISINGIADAFYAQIEPHRPFYSIEDMLFHEEMKTPNKSALSALIRAQALNDLMDHRFTGLKHFWSAVAVDKPATEDKLIENIENPVYREQGDFTREEKIILKADLTKMFPLRDIVSQRAEDIMRKHQTYPVSEWQGLQYRYWFVVRKCIEKKDRRKRPYWILEIMDSSFKMQKIKCWAIKPEDMILENRLYVAKHIEYDEKWGYSTGWKNPPRKNFKLVT